VDINSELITGQHEQFASERKVKLADECHEMRLDAGKYLYPNTFPVPSFEKLKAHKMLSTFEKLVASVAKLTNAPTAIIPCG
jgi:hypothetical protein